ICHVWFGFCPGQGNTGIHEYPPRLASLGFDVHAIVLRRPYEPAEENIKDVWCHRITAPFQHSMRAWWQQWQEARSQLTRHGPFDIIHVYSAPAAGFLPLFARSKGRRWLYDVRSGGVTPGIKGWSGDRLVALHSLFFDATVVLEPRVQQRIFGHLLGHRVMGILPVGINPALFDARDGTELRQRLDLASNELVLIYIGSLSPVRRLHIVLEAFHQALLSELPLKLLIVGEGGAYDQLAAQAEALGLSENVIFTGFVDYHQVPDYLAAADIGLAFVPRTPGFDFQPPLKTLESMAGGLPTIATDTPANQEIIQHRRNGLICQDTVDSLAQAIVELAEDAALRARLAEAARPSVRQFSYTTLTTERLLPLYEQLLGEPILFPQHHRALSAGEE
ncbi:MAG TPA: glycosyltransferase family 1 protein, partial [Anaerolineae bacterium]|nr:glycosyltransferase family 1 protein [Anaerolineae bacterium]